MTPRGWQVIEHYLNSLGCTFTHDVDGTTYSAFEDQPGSGEYVVTPPGGQWAHRIRVMLAPDSNGIIWRVPTIDGRTALFPRTSEDALALVAREHARSRAAVDVAELAARGRRLAVAIRAARDGAAEHERPLMTALDEAAARVHEAARQAEEVAAALWRQATRPDRPCPAEWGVCPEHGATLRLVGGACTDCRIPGCPREWGHDRAAEPCTEPASHRARAPEGSWVDMCAGHVVALRGIENAHEWLIQPLTGAS